VKESPQMKKLEEVLRSSRLVSGGFMGNDMRSISEVIDSDLAKVSKSGFTIEEIGERMQEITNTAIAALGNFVEIDKKLQARVDEAKGWLVCPWPHPARFAKRVTILRNIETGRTIKWSDLNIHLIAEHAFFEGRGSDFRIEPEELIKTIF
jgi:hypothetical protein